MVDIVTMKVVESVVMSSVYWVSCKNKLKVITKKERNEMLC